MLKIVTAPNKILTTATKPVVKIDKKIKRLIQEMGKTLISQKDPIGVGLAAPQVEVNLSIFIIKPTIKSPIKAFINPKILKYEINPTHKLDFTINEDNSRSSDTHLLSNTKEKSQIKNKKQKKQLQLEGCLSIPKIWSPIKRADKVLLQYQDLTGKVIKKWFGGFEAIIIQHEVDHLNGILFTQRALEQNSPLYEENDKKLRKLEHY